MLGGLLGACIAVEAFLMGAEYLTAAYPGAPEAAAVDRLLTGQYAPLFWFEVGVGLGIPFLILVIRRLREDPRWVALAAGIAILGIFVHRLNLVLNGLSYANIELAPGLSIGAYQDGASSFATHYWYVPTAIEWMVVAGVLAFGALVFTIAVAVLPMQEPEAH